MTQGRASGGGYDGHTGRPAARRAAHGNGKEGWGGRRDSNPQQPESQSGTLPLSYDHQPRGAKVGFPPGGVKPRGEPTRWRRFLGDATRLEDCNVIGKLMATGLVIAGSKSFPPILTVALSNSWVIAS
jgi:hypothetical protein